MAKKERIASKRYTGVYYRESTKRKHKGKPDRRYWVAYPSPGTSKTVWAPIGWASEGVSERYASTEREKLMSGSKRHTPRRKRLTVGDAVRTYEIWAEAEGKHVDREMNRYDNHLKLSFDAVPLESITAQMLTEHKNTLLKNLSNQSVLHCFSFLRRCVNHVISEGLHQGVNPFRTSRTSKFKMPKPDNASVRFFSADEARKLLAELKTRSQQLHDMSVLSLKTGMRATEIFTVTGQDVREGSDVIHFTAKGGERQSVCAPEDVITMLLDYVRAPGEYIFQKRGGGKITRGISHSFQRAVDEVKLNDGVTDDRHRVRFHTWRHTFASWLAQSGEVTLQELKELMRHERIEMTMRYAHLIPGHQHKKLSIIDTTLMKQPDKKGSPKLKLVKPGKKRQAS
jgi:integrase